MVYDVILYNGEREIFELRYNILKDMVDKFIVVEFLQTFSGKEKTPEEFLEFPKVEHQVMSSGVYKDEYVPPEMYPNFAIEYAQRETLKKACGDIKDNDIVFVGDVDEIWSEEAIRGWDLTNTVFKIQQIVYYYYLNNRWNRDWAGTFVSKWKNIKNKSWNTLRAGPGERLDSPESFRYLIRDGGWHFTNCMSLEEIKRKIESYSHQEYNTEFFKHDLEKKREQNIDYYGLFFPVHIDEENWPQYLKDNREKYAHLCKKY